MRAALRVVLDTNAFTPLHFDVLARSPMRDLCKRRLVTPVYSGPFFEEMARAYMKDRVRDELIDRWYPFIVQTADRFFDDVPTIWHREVVLDNGRNALKYMLPGVQREMIENMKELPRDGSWALIKETEVARSVEASRLNSQRELSKQMRLESAADLVGVRPGANDPIVMTEPYIRNLVGIIGRGMIEQHVGGEDWVAAADRWDRNRDGYPYLTQFAENVVYKELLFMRDHSMAIDMNAQPDLDIMTFLLNADVFVTNEQGFARRAFNDLWRPRGKRLMTSAEFAKHLESL